MREGDYSTLLSSYNLLPLAVFDLYSSCSTRLRRVRVQIKVDEPLQFKRKAGYANGDVINVTLNYEEIHRYCYTCKRISHEDGTCPELSPKQREVNRIARLKQKEKEELAAREAFSAPTKGLEPHVRSEHTRTEHKQNAEYYDLCLRISNKRDNLAKNVWNRLDHNSVEKDPRYRERYHPYLKDLRADSRYIKRHTWIINKQGRYGDSASSSTWRVKGSSPQSRNIDQDIPIERRRPEPPSYEPRMEWQPVRSAEKCREVQNRRIAEQETAQEVEHESEEDRRRRIKGKAPTEDSSDMEYNLESNCGASETLKTNGLTLQPTSEPIALVHSKKIDNQELEGERIKTGITGKPTTAKETNLLSEGEINQMAEQYASVDFDMDEEILNDDDLLDEVMEEDIVIPETQEVKKLISPIQKKDERDLRGDEWEKAMTKKARP
ncbi:hypothetical protein F2Q70_00020961 [Brassica cretica]|uniref:Zinc knuckle CX2CX4HX4C domain-containing protein n=1 Tax=Brassica cretica TaxID=69181 RepID=A0A8S9GVB2_BRACR|nr:hypothetical protein F2Q70_00020961 [Brassica cretica]KAF3605001.1 hypothetical protein DY000_02046924 [Brassica cretica]